MHYVTEMFENIYLKISNSSSQLRLLLLPKNKRLFMFHLGFINVSKEQT